MAPIFTPRCIYTIKHSGQLVAGLSDTWHEQKRWRVAERMLEEARRAGHTVPVLFAAAEHTDRLLAWACLTKVELFSSCTLYTFSNMALFKTCHLKTDLVKWNGKPLSADFIRPYAICRTPEFLVRSAAAGH